MGKPDMAFFEASRVRRFEWPSETNPNPGVMQPRNQVDALEKAIEHAQPSLATKKKTTTKQIADLFARTMQSYVKLFQRLKTPADGESIRCYFANELRLLQEIKRIALESTPQLQKLRLLAYCLAVDAQRQFSVYEINELRGKKSPSGLVIDGVYESELARSLGAKPNRVYGNELSIHARKVLVCLLEKKPSFVKLIRYIDNVCGTSEIGLVAQSRSRQSSKEKPLHPDGVEGGRYLWLTGKRYDIPKGVVASIIEYMWDKNSVRFQRLIDDILEEEYEDRSICSAVYKANKVLRKHKARWILKPSLKTRQITKEPRVKKRTEKPD
jgi:hypothetical protein